MIPCQCFVDAAGPTVMMRHGCTAYLQAHWRFKPDRPDAGGPTRSKSESAHRDRDWQPGHDSRRSGAGGPSDGAALAWGRSGSLAGSA
jgi:hypothetical protein